jgi:hypothetical protein
MLKFTIPFPAGFTREDYQFSEMRMNAASASAAGATSVINTSARTARLHPKATPGNADGVLGAKRFLKPQRRKERKEKNLSSSLSLRRLCILPALTRFLNLHLCLDRIICFCYY